MVEWLVIFLLILISALPLYFAVKLLGGRVTILKVVLINFIVAAVVAYVKWSFGWFAGILGFFLTLFIYKIAFRIGWLKAFFAWVLQFVIIVAFILLMILLGFAMILV